MDEQSMRRLVESARVGRLATVREDGRAHVVPLCFVFVGDVAYSAVDHKPKRHAELQRLRNVAATGAASLLVDEYDEDWTRLWWVRLDGTGRLVEEPSESERAIRWLREKYPQYDDRPPTGHVLALDVEAWAGWVATDS